MRRRIRRLGLACLVLAPAAWFAPIPVAALFACGLVDISRHRRITPALVEEYFTGKGLLTWALSPLNLLADLLARSPRRPRRLEDLPADCQAEIATCVDAFLEHRAAIAAAIQPHLAAEKRVMLAFRWFGARLGAPIRVPAFEQDFRYIKTIAVSTFSRRESTSWHFGPQRLTLRVLRNLQPVDDPGVFLAVDDQVHHWNREPLVVFDDTFFHQSVNDSAAVRHCLFIDIVRPSRLGPVFDAAVGAMGLMAKSFRAIFYRNWRFLEANPQAAAPALEGEVLPTASP